MFDFLFGKRKKASVATPAGVATATVATGGTATATAVLEPELPELEKVKRNFSKPQLPRDEPAIQVDIDELLRERTALVQAKTEAVSAVEGQIHETNHLAEKALVGLLAIEAELKRSIITKRDTDIKALKEQINRLESDCKLKCNALDGKINLFKIEMFVRSIDATYPRIDMSFLHQTRKAAGKSYELPKFAMFSIDNPKCELQVDGWYNQTSRTTTTPPAYGPLLDTSKVVKYCTDYCRSYGYNIMSVNAVATFKGAIPKPIREVLVDVKRKFECVYLVNEPEWKVEEVAIPFTPPTDPLVIGYRDGIYWLIASFDTTPAEEYIRREFTQGELKDVRG